MTQDKMREALAQIREWRFHPERVQNIVDEALSSERQSAERGEVAVKSLEWRDAELGRFVVTTEIADSIIGQYSVSKTSGAAYFLGVLIEGKGREACQVHFETRIRSVLIAAPAERRVTEAITVEGLFPNVDQWGVKEWFARLVSAVSNRDRCVQEGDELGFQTHNNIASSTASRLAREYAGEITAALAHPVEADAGEVEALRDAEQMAGVFERAEIWTPNIDTTRMNGPSVARSIRRLAALSRSHDAGSALAGEVATTGSQIADRFWLNTFEKHDLAKMIDAALSRSQDAGSADAGWRSIETAPANKAILIHLPNADYYGNDGVYAGMLVDMGTGKRWMTFGWAIGRDVGQDNEPDGWQPLPAAPHLEGKGDRA